LKITLPLPLNRANSRLHWRTENKYKKEYMMRCGLFYVAEDMPMQAIQKAKISATLYTWSPMDTDNLMSRLKWPVDWLVKACVIADDSPRHLVWELPRQEVDRRNQRVEIVLEPLR